MSVLRQLALAALSSLAIAWLWPRDGLFSTVVLLPWAALLVSLATRRLAQDLGRPVELGSGWLWALAALVGLALQRHRLGWAAFDELWLAALLLLALALLLRLLPAMLRQLSERQHTVDRLEDQLSVGRLKNLAPSPVFFVLPLALYLLIQPYTLERRQPDGDEPYYLLLTHSLAHDGDIDLANNYLEQDWRLFMQRAIERQPGDPEGPDGEVFSRHNALLPLALTPAYRLAGRVGATAMMALMTAATAWLMLRLARRRWPEHAGGALLAWAILAFTPPLLLYSHQVWVEVPAALLTLFALDRLDHLRSSGPPGSSSRRRDAALLALSLILLPLLKLRLLLIAGPLSLLALFLLGRRRAMALAGAFVLAVAALMAHNYRRFGNPLKMYGAGEFELLASPPADYLRGLVGMFYDCAFGLFSSAPIWLLLLPALLELLRRRDRFLALLALLALPYLAAVAPRLEWYGGWSPPFRYPLVFLPLFALALVPLLGRRPAGSRAALVALGLPTVAITLLFVAVPGWTYNLADGASHLLHQAGLLLEADVARFFPSTVRAREATWWWLGASLLLAPLALVDRARRLAAPAGFALFFIAAASIPVLAKHLPTRIVEAEDAWVLKTAGRLEPERWMPLRPRQRGGWRMISQTGLRAPVIAGGERAVLRLHVRRDTIGPHRLELFAGQTLLGGLEVERVSDWRVFEFGPVEWPADAPLVVVSPQRARRDDLGLLLDRIEIDWLPADKGSGEK